MQLRPNALLKWGYILDKKDICLLLQLTVAVHEAVNTTGRINELALTGVERVGSAGDFYLEHRVSFAFKFYCLCGLACRL